LVALVLDAGRRVTAARAYRDFRLLWFGALTSSIGTWMQKVAQAWLITTLTGTASAFFLGLDSFLGELPILLFILIGGVIADRAGLNVAFIAATVVCVLPALLLPRWTEAARASAAD